MSSDDSELRVKLNSETGRIQWHELERHYAQGALITVDAELDLVDVAAKMAANDASAVKKWLETGRVRKTAPEEAQRWSDKDQELWCVVVAPWVLVQDGKSLSE